MGVLVLGAAVTVLVTKVVRSIVKKKKDNNNKKDVDTNSVVISENEQSSKEKPLHDIENSNTNDILSNKDD